MGRTNYSAGFESTVKNASGETLQINDLLKVLAETVHPSIQNSVTINSDLNADQTSNIDKNTSNIGGNTSNIITNRDNIAAIQLAVDSIGHANTVTYANTYSYNALGEELLFSKVRAWGDILVVQSSLESTLNYVGDILFSFYKNNGFGNFETANDQVLDGILNLTVSDITEKYSHLFPYDAREQADVTVYFNQSLNIIKNFGEGLRFTSGDSEIDITKENVLAAIHTETISLKYGDFIDFYKAFGLFRYDNDFKEQVLNRTDGLLNIQSINFTVTTLPVFGSIQNSFKYGGFVGIFDNGETFQITYDKRYTINSTYEEKVTNKVQIVPTPAQNPNVPALAVISSKFGDDDKVVDIISAGKSHFSVTGSGKVDMRNGELRYGSATNDFEDNKFGGFAPELANVSAMFIQFPGQAPDANVIHKTYFDEVLSRADFDSMHYEGEWSNLLKIADPTPDPDEIIKTIDFTDPTGQLTNSNIFVISLDDGIVSTGAKTRIETGISDATNNGRLRGSKNIINLSVEVLYNYIASGKLDQLNSRRLFVNTFISRVSQDADGYYYQIDSYKTYTFLIEVVEVPVFGTKITTFNNMASRLWRFYRLTPTEIKNRVKIVGTLPDVKDGDAYQIPPALEVRSNHASPIDPIFTVKSDYMNDAKDLFAVMGDGRLKGVTAIGTKDDRVNTIFMNSEIVFRDKLKFSATNESNRVLQVDTDGSMFLGSNKAIDLDPTNDIFSFVKTADNSIDKPVMNGYADVRVSGIIIGNHRLTEVNGELVVQKLDSATPEYGVLRAGGIGIGPDFTIAKNDSGNITVNNGSQELMAIVTETDGETVTVL
jgi:hypothetical protein